MKRVVDADGRLFGKINLVDAAIGAFVALLLPLAYGAVLLFRPPSPRIISVEPAPLTFTEDRAALGSELAGKVKVRGEALRPVLRATIGGQPALAYIFEDPSTADVLFGNLPAGRHDLILYDGVQEVARAPSAVVIPEKPYTGASGVRVNGTLLDMSEQAARELRVGTKYPSDGEPAATILALGELEPARYLVNGVSETAVPGRWQRRALLSVKCQVSQGQPKDCVTSGVILTPGYVLPLSNSAGSVRLYIDQVLPDEEPQPAELRVRFLGYPGPIDLVKVGDQDRAHWAIDGRGAVIATVGGRRSLQGQISVGLLQEGAAPTASVEATDQVAAIDAMLHLGMDRSRTGWRYRSDLIRIGGPITFTTHTYTVRGVILSMTPKAASHAPTTNGTPQ